MIRDRAAIRDAYRDRQVAGEYIERRFVEPLGALLHDRQLAHLDRVVREIAPRTALEIAPGPARLTVGLQHLQGVAVDASMEMVAQARRRLREAGGNGWRFVQGDVFNLPLLGPFDLVYAFRLIRHFDRDARRRIYEQIAGVLRPGGTLVFDAVNASVSAPLRQAAPDEYQHFDALLHAGELHAELAAHGFAATLTGVQHRYTLLHRIQVLVAPRSRRLARAAMEVVDRSGGEPLEWIVTCRLR